MREHLQDLVAEAEGGPSRSTAGQNPAPPTAAVTDSIGDGALLLPKSNCACGGDCPSCRESPATANLQARRLGESLDQDVGRSMEDYFGTQFSDVLVHHDREAAQSARALDARAYTRGTDIVFGENQFRPDTPEGRTVLAHELAHVVQGRGVSSPTNDGSISHPGAAAEREAHGVAVDYAVGRPLRPIREQARGLHRDPIEVTSAVSETISNAPAAYSAWNGTFSWTSRFGIVLETNRTLTVVMRLYSTASSALKNSWARAIERKWGGRFGLHVSATAGARATCHPINVDVQWVADAADAHYTITPSAVGSTYGGRAGLGGTTSMTDWGTADRVDMTHEFGHMLGNTEEYFTTGGVDYTRGGRKTGFRDAGGGVMNNPGENPRARHYELVRLNAASLLGVAQNLCTVGARCRAQASHH